MKLKSVAMLILLAGASSFARPSSAIVGEYVEARSNHVYTCGCLYSGELVTDGKDAILVWRIREGELQGAWLAGVKVAAITLGEGNLSIETTPRKSVLYLDGVTSSAQQQAIVDLLGQRYRGALGDIVAVHTAPIAFQKEGDSVSVNIGGIARLLLRKAQLPEDAHPGSQLWYPPFIPMTDSKLGTTLYYEYWGKDLDRQWRKSEPGIRGYLGGFALTH